MQKGLPRETAGAHADAQGRMRIVPWEGDGYSVAASPPAGEPYLRREAYIERDARAVRPAVEIKLRRGVALRGRVVEAASGVPVAGARVHYYQVHRDNPLYGGHGGEVATDADGTFAMVVPHGPGDLLVRASTPDFLHIRTDFQTLGSGIGPHFNMYPDGLAHLDLAPGTKEHQVDVSVRRGVTVPCRVVDPEGKPVARAIAFGRSYAPYEEHRFSFISFNGGAPTLLVREGQLDVPGLDPEAPSTFYVFDAKHQLGATVELSGKSAADGPATIRLAPCGSARARFMDKDGKPIAGRGPLDLTLIVTPGADFNNESILNGKPLADIEFHSNLDRERVRGGKSDADGFLTYVSLIPGAPYRFRGHDFIVGAGETTTLPDAIISGGQD
jgi:hypothetical protein